MAEIVNGALSVRKKDLYDHKSFSELYQYNDVINALRDLSKKSFTQYIANGVDYWRRSFERLGTFTEGSLADPSEMSEAQSPTYHIIPINNYRDEVDQESAPKQLIFSVMEVIDGFTFRQSDGIALILKSLRAYIELGLFPLISVPYGERAIYDSFEKFDSVISNAHIGTIVDVFEDGKSVFVNVMWEPQFTVDYPSAMYGNKVGVLQLVNAISTPEVWKDSTSSHQSNFAIPVYELQSNEVIIDMIMTSNELKEELNELCVTGRLNLPFMDFTLAKLAETTLLLQQTNSSERTEPDKAEHVPAPKAKPVRTDIPVEDASVESEFARRMRLYDIDEPASSSGSISEDMFHIEGEEYDPILE